MFIYCALACVPSMEQVQEFKENTFFSLSCGTLVCNPNFNRNKIHISNAIGSTLFLFKSSTSMPIITSVSTVYNESSHGEIKTISKSHQVPKLPSSPSKLQILRANSFAFESTKTQEKICARLKAIEKGLQATRAEISEFKQLWLSTGSLPESHNSVFNDFVASEFNLPCENDEELLALNEAMGNEEKQAKLTRHLFLTCTGANLSLFVTSLLKRMIAKDLAVQYSRLGRKGKKNLQSLAMLYRTIMATVLMKFPDVGVEKIEEKVGRCLSLASDWNGREERPRLQY